MRKVWVAILLMSVVGCSADTLQETYEQQQKDNGMDGINIIHVEEHEDYGLVLAASWSDQFPDNKNFAGIHVFHKVDGKWAQAPGTACESRRVARLVIKQDLYLYCGMIDPAFPLVRIQIGNSEAQMFPFTNNTSVWYATGPSMNLAIMGEDARGRQVRLP